VKPRRPPAVGQHSDEVLREAVDATMIAKLRTDARLHNGHATELSWRQVMKIEELFSVRGKVA
jgi:hypothetical protein